MQPKRAHASPGSCTHANRTVQRCPSGDIGRRHRKPRTPDPRRRTSVTAYDGYSRERSRVSKIAACWRTEPAGTSDHRSSTLAEPEAVGCTASSPCGTPQPCRHGSNTAAARSTASSSRRTALRNARMSSRMWCRLELACRHCSSKRLTICQPPLVKVISYVVCSESLAATRFTALNTLRSSNVPAEDAENTPCSVMAIVPPESGLSVATVR